MDERAAAADGAARGALTATDHARFRAALPAGGRLLGLDLGTRTIGTALCDAGWRFASPAGTIRRTKLAPDLAALTTLAARNAVAGIVLGLPLNMDGTSGPRAQATRAFARALTGALPLPLLLWDERLSSFEAEEALIASGISPARRRERIDAAAAAVILQSAIDQLTNTAD